MTIDLSNNLIADFTNEVPVYVKQFLEPPDKRFFYLNNNRIQSISDRLLQQYGACPVLNPNSTSFFIVGISNMALSGNNLTCGCDSYYLIRHINSYDGMFPEISDETALLANATCAAPPEMVGQKFVFSDFRAVNGCDTYRLPNMTDIFCSVYSNDTVPTLAPPTYWPTPTVATTTSDTYGNGSTTASGSGGGGGGSNVSNN